MQVLKVLFKYLVTIVFAGIILVVALITLLDPNEFKGFIERSVFARTGCQLSIEGPLYWRLDPAFAFEAHDISLRNVPVADNTFLTLKKIRLEAKPWSVFAGQLPITVHIEALSANLSRSIVEFPVWQSMRQLLLAPHKAMVVLLSAIESMTVQNAAFVWQDPVNNQHIEVKNFSLVVERTFSGISASMNDVPITLKFDFLDLDAQPRRGNIVLQGTGFLDRHTNSIGMHNIRCTASLMNLPMALITGELRFHDFNQQAPVLEGKIKTLNFPLHKWLTEFNLFPAIRVEAVDLNSAFKYQAEKLTLPEFTMSWGKNGLLTGELQANLHGKAMNAWDIRGSLRGREIPFSFLPEVADLNATFAVKEGSMTLSNVDANCMNIQHHGTLMIDYKGQSPRISVTDYLTAPEVNDLMGYLGYPDQIMGKMQANMALQTQGHTLVEWMHHLSGHGKVTLTDGYLQGIALPELLRHAQSTLSLLVERILQKQPVNVEAVLTAELNEWKQQSIDAKHFATPFRTLETDMTVENGNLNTSSFTLLHPDYSIRGHGNLNFVERSAYYQAEALLSVAASLPSAPALTTYLQEKPLAFRVQGPIENLNIRPDLGHYAEGAMQLVQEQPLDPSTQETLEKLFGF